MKDFDNEKRNNHELTARVMQLEKLLEEKDGVVQQLQNKCERLTLGVAFTGSSVNTHEAKIKINRIVREIDQCIALLNR